MAIFLILAPYGAYTFLMLVTSATISVFVASASVSLPSRSMSCAAAR